MKEIKGDLWDYYDREGYVICITTNGFVRKDGKATMGRGCAKEANEKIQRFAEALGAGLQKHGNVCLTPFGADYDFPECRVLTFPVKRHWRDKASMTLIARSAKKLKQLAKDSTFTFVLPRPGCGHGYRKWKDVKKLLKDLPDNVLVISK